MAPIDIFGVAASDLLEPQNALSGGASTTKRRNASQLIVYIARNSYDYSHRTPTQGRVIYAVVGFISLIIVSSLLGTVSAHNLNLKLSYYVDTDLK